MPAAVLDESKLAHRHADLSDVRLHYVEMGEGPLVVLLHGFPEFWYAWRHQIPALADAGYRVVAPDTRGYNLSSKPGGVRPYAVDRLAADVAGLVRWCGEERAGVVGHDWGGAAAWEVAMRHPEVVERLAILNVPHPRRLLESMRNPLQLLRFSYIFFFQLPALPEAALAAGNHAVLRRVLTTDPRRPGAYSPADIERYVEAWSQPGALAAALNYYRASVRRNPRAAAAEMKVIDAPTLVIWGERDVVLGGNLAQPDPSWVPDARVERLPEASHWVPADEPDRVSELLIDFMAPLKPRAGRARR